MLRIIAVLLLLVSTQVEAQSAPSFDCSKAESAAEELVCEDTNLARLDRLVADRYAAALSVARGLDSAAAEAEGELRALQRGWIQGRDECWKASDPRECVEAAYLRREGALVANWLLETPTRIAYWACDGNPSNEVVTYFFNTELPSVRFERGDTVDTGSLARTASGFRYEGSFGRSIWIKGRAATYREPDPDGTSFECVLDREE